MDTIFHNFFDLHKSGESTHKAVTLSYQHTIFPFLFLGFGATLCVGLVTAEWAVVALAKRKKGRKLDYRAKMT